MKSIKIEELKQWKQEDKSFQLIDVRELDEHQSFNIGGTLIPLSEVVKRRNEIDLCQPVIFYCKRGIRSQIAIQKLMQKMDGTNFYNLTGGILMNEQRAL